MTQEKRPITTANNRIKIGVIEREKPKVLLSGLVI
jgi:hypothetical protein